MLHTLRKQENQRPQGRRPPNLRKQRIFDFLQSHPVGVLSTVTPDNDPHGTVIYFNVNPDMSVEFLTRSLTKKYDNLLHNKHVMLTVFEPRTQTTVQIMGTAREERITARFSDLANAARRSSITTSDIGVLPISKLDSGSYVAIAIKPVQIRMAVYAKPKSGDYDTLFESLESFDLYDIAS